MVAWFGYNFSWPRLDVAPTKFLKTKQKIKNLLTFPFFDKNKQKFEGVLSKNC